MHHLLTLAVLLVLAGQAHAQTLTFDELVGARFEVKIEAARTDRAGGEVRQQHVVYRHTVQPEPNNRVQYSQTFTFTFNRPGRQTVTRSWSGNVVLGVPYAFRDGQRVWIFENDALISLRTLDEGGSKLVIRAARTAEGFTCQAALDYAREIGVGKITSNNSISGKRVDILSEKQLSSDCRVSR